MSANEKITKFAKGTNAGTRKCTVCGKRRWDANMQGELCIDCYEDAGRENAHIDGHHKEDPDPQCEMCQDEMKIAPLAPASSIGKREARKIARDFAARMLRDYAECPGVLNGHGRQFTAEDLAAIAPHFAYLAAVIDTPKATDD